MNDIAFDKAQEIVKIHAENELKLKAAQKNLRPCPLCGSAPFDNTSRISCNVCGLSLDDGPLPKSLGGYRNVWNTRA